MVESTQLTQTLTEASFFKKATINLWFWELRKVQFQDNFLILKIHFLITLQRYEEAKVQSFVFLVEDFSSWFSRSAKLWETAISSTPTLTNEALHTSMR